MQLVSIAMHNTYIFLGLSSSFINGSINPEIIGIIIGSNINILTKTKPYIIRFAIEAKKLISGVG